MPGELMYPFFFFCFWNFGMGFGSTYGSEGYGGERGCTREVLFCIAFSDFFARGQLIQDWGRNLFS